MNDNLIKQQQRGAVSLFVVLFTSLLVIIITVGFVQLMVRNQQQATQSDLSQSAYDSALAGVEDAKRAMVLSKKCAIDSGTSPLCSTIDAKINSNTCSTLSDIFDGSPTAERKIQQTESDASLDQAYTCVKIIQNTPDYVRKGLQPGKSHIIPLRVDVASGASFDTIEIKWFTREDVSEDFTGNNDLPADAATLGLPPPVDSSSGVDKWPNTAPPLLRTQLIKTGAGFNLADLDKTGGTDGRANTLFLYPSSVPQTTVPFSSDPGITMAGLPNKPQSIDCQNTDFPNGGYACTATLPIGSSINGAYLRLSALYNKTRYKVVMKTGGASGTVVPFYGVQPEVDSTGRANDLFRRVKARVQFESTDFPYPEDAVYLYGSLCKNFWVTSNPAHFKPGGCDVSADDMT